ncbi:hypothetical protein N7452_008559 [Penicillium brevicompactum]|uniref:Uncharacterized protein n=1 Tax=Penicillium brevicompactum TaxID=5074 RepID=A0A9W9Q6Q6_PENBR|nr:hypothetical protein N7452_008559 [Penicillium brevicompactum]
MKLNALAILFLVCLASAANIKTFWAKGCKGGYLGHPGIKVRQCSNALRTEPDVRGARSVQYLDMPHGAQCLGLQQARSRAANLCGALAKRGTAGASGNFCLGPKSDLQYAGASRDQPARAAGISSAGNLTADEACTETVKPSKLVLDEIVR